MLNTIKNISPHFAHYSVPNPFNCPADPIFIENILSIIVSKAYLIITLLMSLKGWLIALLKTN